MRLFHGTEWPLYWGTLWTTSPSRPCKIPHILLHPQRSHPPPQRSLGTQMSPGTCKEVVTCMSSMLMSQHLETWMLLDYGGEGIKKLELRERVRGRGTKRRAERGGENRDGSQKNAPRGPFPGSQWCSVKGDPAQATGTFSSMHTHSHLHPSPVSCQERHLWSFLTFILFSNFTTQTLWGAGWMVDD